MLRTITVTEAFMVERVLRLPQVVEATGLSRSSIYQYVAEGRFPKPIHLGSKYRIGWPESVVQEWIQQQITAAAKR